MELALNIASWVFILAGSFFYIVGAAGILRMPDVFSRMHAASVSDTTGASLLLIGMMFQAGVSLVLAKLFMIWFFILFTGPVATHALARAARYAGIEPLLAGSSAEPSSADKVESKPAPSKRKSTTAKRSTAKKTTTKRTAAKKAPPKRKSSTTRGKTKS